MRNNTIPKTTFLLITVFTLMACSTNTGASNTPTCSGVPTVELTEGPYFKAGSPEQSTISTASTVGQPLTLTGYVYDQNCNPIADASLDFWQADGQGQYDNAGYNLRGHQTTDASGKYTLQTVVPGEYPGRTPHIHVKIAKSSGASVTTSQLFLPDVAHNSTDSIFNAANAIQLTDASHATFNFVI